VAEKAGLERKYISSLHIHNVITSRRVGGGSGWVAEKAGLARR